MIYDSVIHRLEGEPVVELAWFSAHIRFFSDNAHARRYMEEHYHAVKPPPVAPPTCAEHTLYALTDPALLDSLRQQREGAVSEKRESFSGWWYESWVAADGSWVLVSGQGHEDAHALLTRDFCCWAIINTAPASLGTIVARVTRELIREQLLSMGALMLHASAAILPDGTGCLLAGASAAGKTSTVIHIARAGGHAVATDRALALKVGNAWVAVGLPLSTRLGLGALQGFGVIDTLGQQALLRHGAGVTSTQQDPAAIQFGSKNKISLSNAEVFSIFGGGFCSATPINSIVLLNGDSHARLHTVEVQALEHARELMREHILAPDPVYRSFWLAREPHAFVEERTLEQIDDLLCSCRISQITWNPASPTAHRIVELLGGVATDVIQGL